MEDNSSIILTGNSLILKCVDKLLMFIGNEDEDYEYGHEYEFISPIIDSKSFDEDISFYKRFLSETVFQENYRNGLPRIIIRNMYIYLNYLKYLVESIGKTNDNLYKNKKIKLDISILFGYFLYNYNKALINLPQYYLLCIKELEINYNLKCIDFSCPFDTTWKNEAKKVINKLRKLKKAHIIDSYKALLTHYSKKKDYKIFDDIEAKKSKFIEDCKIKDDRNLHNNYINNFKYINEFLELRIAIHDEKFESEKEELKNYLFYIDILEINLDDIFDVITFLDFYDKNQEFKEKFNIDIKFKKYQKEIKSNISEENKLKDYQELLNPILNDKEFYNKLKAIMKSEPIKTYFKSKRNFIDDEYGVVFIDNEDSCDDDLRKGYETFMENFDKDINYIKDLIIIKYLPENIRAYVNPYMRIALNPLFFEISEYIRQNQTIRNNILSSYLIIIFIHEIVHLLKFLNIKLKESSFINIPGTQKQKEGGMVFMNYLFAIPMIKSINYEQSKIINNIKNWDNLDNLRKIFIEKNENEKKEESQIFIKYCSTDFTYNEIDSVDSYYDPWCDLN